MSPELPKPEAGPNGPETAAESPETGASFETPKAAVETAVETPAPASTSAAAAPVPMKDETTAGVETILEEGMQETYKGLPPAARVRFKREGERLTKEIVGMVKSLKVKAARILELITRWLKIIPGVNRFFLIQEAKIKTDRVLALAAEEKKKRGL